MEYSHEIENDILVLRLSGDLIGENHGPELISIINDTINDDIVFCAIDIQDVRYINSSGIGVLITILTKFRNKGGEVVLIKPSDSVEKLLVITKLNSIFTIVTNLDQAFRELVKS
ncbi:MAG: STAS domain-containing protein [Cyclobacteriaceae bacterium]|nr:STAS domain-containing protein [Cyclobacteriaceae bacterium]